MLILSVLTLIIKYSGNTTMFIVKKQHLEHKQTRNGMEWKLTKICWYDASHHQEEYAIIVPMVTAIRQRGKRLRELISKRRGVHGERE